MALYDDHLAGARAELEQLLHVASETERYTEKVGRHRHAIVWRSRADKIRGAIATLDSIPGMGAVLAAELDERRAARGDADPLNRLRHHVTGAIERGEAEPIVEQRPPVIATCGACGLSWNDAEPTSMTPAPSARCPFETFHPEDGTELEPDDIPAYWPVQPIAADELECEGHPAGPFDPMGQTVYCDGSCRREHSGSRRAEIVERDAPELVAPTIAARLEELRAELRAERISYGELIELQGLAEHIDPADVELLEAAGVPEHLAELEQTRAELERRPEPTTPDGATAHDLAREILADAGKTFGQRAWYAYKNAAEELARLVLASDTLEELER